MHSNIHEPPWGESIYGAKLLWDYERLLKKVKPDLILTYSIKPNIYIACSAAKSKFRIMPMYRGWEQHFKNQS